MGEWTDEDRELLNMMRECVGPLPSCPHTPKHHSMAGCHFNVPPPDYRTTSAKDTEGK